MSIQPVFSNQRASEVPASRRRAEGSAAGEEGTSFVLPGQNEGNTAAADKGDGAQAAGKAAAADEAVAADAVQKAATAAIGKGDVIVKPGVAVSKPAVPQQAAAQPENPAPVTGIDFLVAMAEAQAEAAGIAQGEGKPKAGEAKPADGEQKAAETKKDDGTAETGAGPQPGADQIKMAVEPQHPVTVPALALPIAAASEAGTTAPAEDASAIVADEAGKARTSAALVAPFVKPDGSSVKQAATAAEGDAAAVTDGKISPFSGHLAGSKDTQEKPAVDAGSKVEAAVTAAAPAAVDQKPLDNLQQLLGPLDLSSMAQQALGKPGHDRLVQPLDPNLVPGGATTAQGQAQAGGQPTPIHVVPIEIGLRAMAGAKQFDIRLDPDELGRVDVNLSISDKGEVSARLVVDRVETLHLLQRDARTLERAFEQAGLKPSDGGVDISLRDPSDQSAFRQNRQHDEAPQRPRVPHGAEIADDVSVSTDPAPQRRLVRLGGVDLSI